MLRPPLFCKKLVQMDLKLKSEFAGSVVRRLPYPASQDQIKEIKRGVQESIDAGLVEEYPRHFSPWVLVAKPGSTAMRLVVDCDEVNKKGQTTQGVCPTWRPPQRELPSVD